MSTALCAAPCGVELSACNLINNDTAHPDCRCLYRECGAPLLDVQAWRRHICDACWVNPRYNVQNVKLRPLPRLVS